MQQGTEVLRAANAYHGGRRRKNAVRPDHDAQIAVTVLRRECVTGDHDCGMNEEAGKFGYQPARQGSDDMRLLEYLAVDAIADRGWNNCHWHARDDVLEDRDGVGQWRMAERHGSWLILAWAGDYANEANANAN